VGVKKKRQCAGGAQSLRHKDDRIFEKNQEGGGIPIIWEWGDLLLWMKNN